MLPLGSSTILHSGAPGVSLVLGRVDPGLGPYYRILAAGSYLVIAAIILLFETALWESALAMTLAFCALLS